ncbi:hypothetical protein VFPPC_15663 [Pochonia chlamydosporia 170]|uniref:Uncharacterized protein n=1 Tax=Pochonia chlamydosporia 170 TaxID=1380566 RepID=A0A179G1C1_METCM|nr:hypothetical protein VFPPC_15663 [Pochonia chlamydosporia 170]OAQ71153.1 hypothetical protein VFPPC_15663 [Pochonia chlamydosporia 170]
MPATHTRSSTGLVLLPRWFLVPMTPGSQSKHSRAKYGEVWSKYRFEHKVSGQPEECHTIRPDLGTLVRSHFHICWRQSSFSSNLMSAQLIETVGRIRLSELISAPAWSIQSQRVGSPLPVASSSFSRRQAVRRYQS